MNFFNLINFEYLINIYIIIIELWNQYTNFIHSIQGYLNNIFIVITEFYGQNIKYILNITNQNDLTNIYTGITGLLVAIVIFIAEIIKEQKNELYKKIILTKTRIKCNIILTLAIFSYMIIINTFKYNETVSSYDIKNIIFIVLHLILLILIFVSAFKTGKMFIIALKLNIEKNYFNKKLEEILYKKVRSLEKKACKKNKKNLKSEELKFKEFIDNQDIYFIKTNIKNIEEFEPIFPLKNGIVKSFDYKKLNELIENFKINKINENEYNNNSKNIVGIIDCIGKKVNKNEAVFYCLKQYKNIFKNINDIVFYTDCRFYIDDEIKLINNCLFELAFEFDDFDKNNRLFNYFKYLYDNKLYIIKSMALDNIEETYRKVYDNYNKNKKFCDFLNLILSLAYINCDYDDYKLIHNTQLNLYIYQLKSPNIDIKQIAFDFANDLVRSDIFSARKNNDKKYYENLISILFKFIIELIKLNKYDAINIIFDNIYIERINYMDDSFDDYNIINFQFCIGVIYSLIILEKQKKINDEDISEIKKIFNYMKYHFIYIHDIWKAIYIFKRYFNMKSEVQCLYANFDFEFINHQYKNSFNGVYIDERSILKEFIYIFDIKFINTQYINLDEIKKNDKYYYQELSKIISADENINLDKFLKIKYDSTNLNKIINIITEEAEKKEREFNRNNELNEKSVIELEELTRNKIAEEIEIIKILKEYYKVQNDEIKLDKVFGINQIIPRDYFFDNNMNSDTFAKNFAGAFEIGIEKEYTKKIEQISVKSQITFELELEKIDNLEDYVIILNYSNDSFLDKYGYNYENDTITFNKKIIKIIYIPQMDSVVLIKKENLPIIKYCQFSDEWEKKYIDKNIYYEFNDLSKNDDLRKSLIEKTEWLKEKGSSEEQDNYLKENCRIKIYLAYKIDINKDSNAISFEIEN